MDPCWKLLPTDLVDYICGTWLPRVRGMPLAFHNELRDYISTRDMFIVMQNYTDLYGITRSWDVFCDDMFNILNNYQEECHSQFLMYNAWNPRALWSALSEEQRSVLLIEI
jgi:hypothetical protein